MKQSLIKKLCFAGIGIIGLFVLLNIILTYFLLIPFSTYLSEKQMEELIQSIENRDDYTDDEFINYIETFDMDMNTQVTIVDRDKKIICTTKVSDYRKKRLGPVTREWFDNQFSRLEKGKIISYTRNKEDNRIEIKIIKKIADNRYAILTRSYRSLQNATRAAILFEGLAGITLILLSVIIIYRMSFYLVVPIREMTVAAEHISNMEFDLKVNVRTKDELGQLGNSINELSKHLQHNLDMLQEDIESRKRLVRNLSHEIKSPIAVIMGYAERLKIILAKDPQKALSYCEIISNESARVDGMVKEMLELSKLESNSETLNLTNIQAEEFFSDLCSRFKDENIGKRIEYIEDYDPKEEFLADYNLIERAVYNLLENAMVYGAQENLCIKVSGRKQGDYYEFAVFNTGSAIKEEEKEFIWQAFTKEDKARTRGRGYGVGLAIVREIIEMHHGYYSVKNLENGVEFCIAVKNKPELFTAV